MGIMKSVFWFFSRFWVLCRRGRLPPPSLEGPVWYFAYGSNMNERLFRERRHMTPLETRIGRLHGYRLRFAVGGGARPDHSAPADIVESPGSVVDGVLYLLPLRKFVRLDASEGAQYGYLWSEAEDSAGARVPMVTFKGRWPAVEGRPSLRYLALIREAARQRGLPPETIEFLDRIETME